MQYLVKSNKISPLGLDFEKILKHAKAIVNSDKTLFKIEHYIFLPGSRRRLTTANNFWNKISIKTL